MNRNTALVGLAALMVAGASFAAPDKGKKPAKTNDVTVCVISGHAADNTVASEKYGKYTLHFCCAKCQPGFDKLSKKEKAAKIKAAIKVQNAPKPKSTSLMPSEGGKLTQVNVCPITGEAVKGEGGGSSKVGTYEVHFCCAGCKPAFDKLSATDKEAKIKSALAK